MLNQRGSTKKKDNLGSTTSFLFLSQCICPSLFWLVKGQSLGVESLPNFLEPQLYWEETSWPVYKSINIKHLPYIIASQSMENCNKQYS